MPGGGVDGQGHWKRQAKADKYLFPVKALFRVFRAKYVGQIRQGGLSDKALSDKDWVVYAKRPLGGPKKSLSRISGMIEHLGRYTHKVAISNHRIKAVTDNEATFSYKDCRDAGKNRVMTLGNTEVYAAVFAALLVPIPIGILPHRFVRIRHYGILGSSWKRGKLQGLQDALHAQRPP